MKQFMLMLAAFFLLGMLLLPGAALDTPVLCDVVDDTSHGEAMQWNNATKAYPGTPPDLYYLETLYIDDPRTTEQADTQAYFLFYSKRTGELWIFPMWSMETAPASAAPGYTCAPRRYDLEE